MESTSIFQDSLRGYGYPIHKRDGFVCVYCGLDGKCWPNWLYLSVDHLLPPRYPGRDNPDYIVTACIFCNTLHNRTDFDVAGKTPKELVEQKKGPVLERRNEYKQFWEHRVEGEIARVRTVGSADYLAEQYSIRESVIEQQLNAAEERGRTLDREKLFTYLCLNLLSVQAE